VGRAMGPRSINWRPDYSPALIRRELEIIRTELRANAVRLGARDPARLLSAAAYALELGLHVWVCPELWNGTPQRTLEYLIRVAPAIEKLRRRWPDQVTLAVGNELTMFMRGIVPGRTFNRRTRVSNLRELVLSQRHTPPLRAFLADAV